jgi:hypothetical protein
LQGSCGPFSIEKGEVSNNGLFMNARIIYEHLTSPLSWVMACFVGLFFLALGGYQNGHIPGLYAACMGALAVIGYGAAHFTQYRIGRSLEMAREAEKER